MSSAEEFNLAQHKISEISEGFCPLFLSTVSAGFPSPADEYLDRELNLNELLVKNKSATFYVRVTGDSMKNAGILPNALLVVDRSLKAKHGSIILAVVDGEFTVKRLHCSSPTKVFLVPENENYKALEVDPANLVVWGVVCHAINSYR